MNATEHKCPICGMPFDSEEDLDMHEKDQHGGVDVSGEEKQ